MLINKGLNSYKDYIRFILKQLRRYCQKVSKQLNTSLPTFILLGNKLLYNNLNNKAKALYYSLNFFLNINNYLKEKISNIKNYTKGNNII
jgi:hypothetical protein